MTIGVVLIGVLLYKTRNYWKGALTLLPEIYTLNNGYIKGIASAERSAYSFTNIYMSGLTRDYLQYILGTMILLIGGFLLLSDHITFTFSDTDDIEIYEILLAIGLAAGAFTVLLSKKTHGYYCHWSSWLFGRFVLRYFQGTGPCLDSAGC